MGTPETFMRKKVMRNNARARFRLRSEITELP
jgi:hypothetical protein